MAAEAQRVTSDGIEPPLSDLESEVLPLHHGAFMCPEKIWKGVQLVGGVQPNGHTRHGLL